MEINKKEVEIIAGATAQAEQVQIALLNDLQLTLIGGGCGEITFG